MKLILKIVGALLIVAAGAGGYYYYSSLEKPYVIKEDGVYDEVETYSKTIVKASSVVLENKTIQGSLTIESDGSNDLYLKNLDIDGDIIVKSPKEEYTIYLDNVSSRKLKIESEFPVMIELKNETSIKDVETNQNITIKGNELTAMGGLRNLTINEKENAQVMLFSTGLEMLIVNTPSNVLLDKESIVDNAIINQPTTLVNEGDVGLLSANANVSYLTKPANIAAADKVIVKDSNQVTTKAVTTAKATKATTAETTKRGVVATTKATSGSKSTTKATTKTTTKSTTTTSITTPKNTPPVFTAEDTKLMVGAKFNPLQGISVMDLEDGRGKLIDKNIVSNTVDVTQAGTYSILYTYTDKGGLTTTFTRWVSVSQDEKKVVAPKNLRFNYDNEGSLQFAWDSVSGAFDYNVYVNGALVESGVRKNYAYVEKYINVTKENQLSVVAYASPASVLQASVPASIPYTAEKGEVTMPESVYAQELRSVSIFFRFHDLFVNIRPINKVSVKVERYENRVYVPVSDLNVTYNKRTDETGVAMLLDYPRAGSSLDATFTKPGSYRLTFTLLDTNGVHQVLEKKFDVISTSGSVETTSSEPVVSDFYVVYSEGSSYDRSDWDAYLVFYLPNELNTKYPENDISVGFYYDGEGGSEVKIEELSAGDLRLSRRLITANEMIRVRLSKGDNTGFDSYVKDNYTKAINITAKVTIIDNNKEYITKTRKIRLI